MLEATLPIWDGLTSVRSLKACARSALYYAVQQPQVSAVWSRSIHAGRL
jgi:hypothetical protein